MRRVLGVLSICFGTANSVVTFPLTERGRFKRARRAPLSHVSTPKSLNRKSCCEFERAPDDNIARYFRNQDDVRIPLNS